MPVARGGLKARIGRLPEMILLIWTLAFFLLWAVIAGHLMELCRKQPLWVSRKMKQETGKEVHSSKASGRLLCCFQQGIGS